MRVSGFDDFDAERTAGINFVGSRSEMSWGLEISMLAATRRIAQRVPIGQWRKSLLSRAISGDLRSIRSAVGTNFVESVS